MLAGQDSFLAEERDKIVEGQSEIHQFTYAFGNAR